MHKSITVLGLLLMVASLAPATQAQLGVEIHRLEIRDGKVFHDGVELPATALPDDFDADGVSFTFEYSGPVMPAVTLNGQVYALEGDRLVAIGEAGAEEGVRAVGMMPLEHGSAEERRRRAEEAYLQTLSERDRALYERLLAEREMEEECLRIAYAARRASDPAQQERLHGQLQRQLEEMFELKQRNRREEIRQIETLLEAMHRQMAEREEHRDDIVRQHMRELLGEH